MDKKVEITRVFNASIEAVWQLWTTSSLVEQWWGPDHFTCPFAKINFQEGATSLVSMQAPISFGGQTHYNTWTYTKIVLHERIEFIQKFADKDGNIVHPTLVGMPEDFPVHVKTIVTFRSIADSQTEMTVTELADFGQMSHFAKLGLEQSINKAVKYYNR
jgi:uncharacterized protein YndB with AHSA1/START domain